MAGLNFRPGRGMNESFPDPFMDVASLNMPQSMRNALQWSEYIYMSHGTYRMALERIISYFLTDIEFGDDDVGDEEKEKWTEFMTDTLDVYSMLQCSMRNRMCYGNDFVSILVPFKRFLACPTERCGNAYPLKVVAETQKFKFAWENMQFVATCPTCGKRGPWRVDDKSDDEEKRIKLKHWNPHEMEMLHDPYTNEVAYLWRIPEDYKQMVKKGNLYHLERVPLPVIDTIRRGQKMFRFNEDVIYHMKEPTLAGIRNRGWGIPRTLSNFRQIYYVQVLRRYNEAIALDYVIPFRLITPAPRGGGGGGGASPAQMMDPLMAFNAGDMRSQIKSMVRQRRRDPAGWNVLPFPVQYQMLGGDANALAPVELINQGTEQLLNDVGTPVELYKGTLQLQTAPVALRLFESTWHHLVHDANAMIKWMIRQISQIMSWEVVNAKLARVTIADDLQKQMMMMQLMMGQQMSGTSAFKAIGLDWKAQQKQLGDEAIFQAEQAAKVQEKMDQAGFAAEMAKGNVGPNGQPAQGGQPAPGGAPPAGGGGQQQPALGGVMPGQTPVASWLANQGPDTPVQPEDMLQAADSLAQQLLGLPESVKDSDLKTLKQKNEVMHSLVKSRMDKIRTDTKNQAGAAAMGQQGAAPPPA